MKKTFTVAAALAVIIAASPSYAKTHKARTVILSKECNVTMPCEGGFYSKNAKRFMNIPFGAPLQHYTPQRLNKQVVPLSGIVSTLAAKVQEISSSCGSKVISSIRHTYIAGTRRISLHASGKAVDMSGNPSCIYAHLNGWQGGYSIDYGRVRPHHVHISFDPEGGREMGVHFVHGGHRHHRVTRYAHRHRTTHVYAQSW